MFLISFARSNTVQLLADLTFSPSFLTCKMQFSMLVSPFFSHFLQALCLLLVSFSRWIVISWVWSSSPWFFSPSRNADSIIYLWLQESPLQSSIQVPQFNDFTALRLKKAKLKTQKNIDLFIFPFSLIKSFMICLIGAVFYSHVLCNILTMSKLALPPVGSINILLKKKSASSPDTETSELCHHP